MFVGAPAGYGKTTLLIEWAHRLRARGWRTTWRLLDPHDDTPERVAAMVDGALHSIQQGGPPAALFLDEIEVLRSEAAQAAARDRIARLPPGRTVIAASRTVPALGLAQLRLRGELREVRADELRFDVAETASLVRGEHGIALDERALGELQRRTEGWVAAIRLTALALEGRKDAGEFVRRLAGDRAAIAEYLAESVLAQQPPDVRRFLLDTSILERLSGPLCDALTGGVDGDAMLERLERAQLFLQPLDEAREWFRYHPLLTEFLRARLARTEPERIHSLHRAASDWHAAVGSPIGAIAHAFSSGDESLAATRLDAFGLAAVRSGRTSATVGWAGRLGRGALDAHPRIRVASAWAHVFLREADEARAALRAISPRRRRTLDPRDRDEILTIEAAAELCEDRVLDAMEVARANLAKLSCDGTFAHGAISNIVGSGLLAVSRFEEARSYFTRGRASLARAGSRFGEGYSIALLGLAEALQGRLGAALSVCRAADALDGAAGERYARAVVAAHAAEVLYERGDLAEAEERLRDALHLGDDFSWLGATGLAPLTLARIRFAAGDRDEAQRLLDSAEHEALRRRYGYAVSAVRWERVRFALRRGDVAAARGIARAIEPFAEQRGAFHPLTESEARDLGALRLRLRTGEARKVVAEIETLATEADAVGRACRGLKLAILRVEALDALGERSAALRALRRALVRGAGEGFVRSFVDEGEVLVPRLTEIRREIAGGDDEIPVAFVDRILAAAGAPGDADEHDPAPPAGLLSARELEVLALAARGLSNQALASRLYISENTVKTHLKNAFAKLGAKSRTAALFSARKLGLLP